MRIGYGIASVGQCANYIVYVSYPSGDDIGVWDSGVFYLDYNGNGAWDGCTVDKCYGGIVLYFPFFFLFQDTFCI